jgi:nucleoside phosphorylase
MASKYTKIARAIEEFKSFLDYNKEEYSYAYKHIKKSSGFAINYYEDELYNLAQVLPNNLYEEIYPKLIDSNPCSDEEIILSFKGTLKFCEEKRLVFDNILTKKNEQNEDVYFNIHENILHHLTCKTILKLKEVIKLAEEDIITHNNTLISDNSYLIGIITATFAEFNYVKDRLKLTDENLLPFSEEDLHPYYEGSINEGEKKLGVILTRLHHQGLAAASTVTTKLILRFKPHLVVMLGHAAGNKNLLNDLNLGDILICETSVNYDQLIITQKDYKEKDSEITEKEKKFSIESNKTLVHMIENFASKDVLNSIKEISPIRHLFAHELGYKKGKLISGDALVRSEDWFKKVVSDNHGTIGLDMETYGVYYSAQHTTSNKLDFISIKSVSDFGSHKNNFPEKLNRSDRVAYALHTSGEFFFKFAITHLPFKINN